MLLSLSDPTCQLVSSMLCRSFRVTTLVRLLVMILTHSFLLDHCAHSLDCLDVEFIPDICQAFVRVPPVPMRGAVDRG